MAAVGSGLAVSFPDVPERRGRLKVIAGLPDVMALIGEPDLGERLLWIEEPVVTLIAPVMEYVGAVLCPSGGPAAHVSIVARELDLVCLMRCELDGAALGELDGAALVVRPDGTILREE
jgi:hypothetical protein